MKKTVALILVILMALALTTPFLALSEANPPATTEAAQNGSQELTEAPVIENDAPGVIDPDPGRPVIDITQLILGLLTILMGMLTRYVIPWIKARTTVWQRQLLSDVIGTAVYAAEQLWGAGHGDEKLDYVLKNVEERGYVADRAMIEAVVKSIPKKASDSLKTT